MNWITVLGLVAATCTTIAFLPQAIKIWKMKEAKEISLTTFIIFSTGILLWLIYGILVQDLPVTLANAVSLVLAITILYFRIKYG